MPLTRFMVPVQFPPGEIIDRDGFVWATLPPGTEITHARLYGTCSCDLADLAIEQVTIDQEGSRRDMFAADVSAPFPDTDRSIEITDPRARSTTEAPVRVTVHVRRVVDRTERDEKGRLLHLPDPITFQLTLLVYEGRGRA